jgi:hypothetical protein
VIRIPNGLAAAGTSAMLALALGTVPLAAASTETPVGRSNHGSLVTKGFSCGIGSAGLTTDSHEVQTPSGNANLVCRGQTTPQTETVSINNVPCGTSYGLTTDSHLVMTKSGKVSLTCHFHA